MLRNTMENKMNISCPQCTNPIAGQAPGSLFCPSCEYLFDVDEDGVEVFQDIDVVPLQDGVSGAAKIVNPRALEEDPSDGRIQKYFIKFAFVYYLIFGIIWAVMTYNMKSVRAAVTFSAVFVCYLFGRQSLARNVKSLFNLEVEESRIARYMDILFVLIIWPVITKQ